ncbi:MAG: hypothetical protein AMXMBFR53_21050 [Gemmatimonadota bacterium]
MISKQALGAGFLLLAVFVAGAFSGVALTRLGPAGHGTGFPAFPPGAMGPPRPTLSPGRGPFPDRDFFSVMLARRLDLSAEQEAQVREMLQVHREKLDSILAGIRPSMEEQFREMDAAIKGILTADQAREFETFMNEEFARLGGRNPLGSPRGPRGAPPGRP